MNFNGVITLEKANPPKNIIDWDMTTKRDIGTSVRIVSYVTVSGTKYTTITDVVIECTDVWAVAGQWDGTALRLYAASVTGSKGNCNIITTTTVQGYPDGDHVTTNVRDIAVSPTATNIGTYAVPSGEEGYVSGGNFIPLFPEYNQPINYLNTGEGDPNKQNTNGLQNGNEVPTEGKRTITTQYYGCEIELTNAIISATSKPYREAIYVTEIKDGDGIVYYAPCEVGTSWLGDAPTYEGIVKGGSYVMTDSEGASAFFPNIEYSPSGMVGTNVWYQTAKNETDNNGKYYAMVFGSYENKDSLMPLSTIDSEWDIIDSTFTTDVPMFDSREKLVKYLLGEIDADQSVSNPDEPNSVETPNGEPEQNMVAGDGVNFI